MKVISPDIILSGREGKFFMKEAQDHNEKN